MNTILQLSTLCIDPERPKTAPLNDRTELMHRNKQALKADFRLKL